MTQVCSHKNHNSLTKRFWGQQHEPERWYFLLVMAKPEIAAEACLGRILDAAPKVRPNADTNGLRRLGLTL